MDRIILKGLRNHGKIDFWLRERMKKVFGERVVGDWQKIKKKEKEKKKDVANYTVSALGCND